MSPRECSSCKALSHASVREESRLKRSVVESSSRKQGDFKKNIEKVRLLQANDIEVLTIPFFFG